VGQQGADITSIELETEGEVAGHRRRNVFQNGRNREGHMSGIEGAQGSEDQREGDPAVSLRRQPAGASCCDCRHPSENKSVPTELGPQSSIDMISLFAGMGRHVGKRSAELGGFDQNPGE
jgi:hypothetical protein